MEEFEWNVVNEGLLLDAMVGHKPVGVNKHFQMALICEKFCEAAQKEINPDKIWSHLETMYNLEALDEGEFLPFPNPERDFSLPEQEFAPIITKREEDKKVVVAQPKKEPPKVVKEIKKEEKTPVKTPPKEPTQRRDSKDSVKEKTLVSAKKEIKKEPEKPKVKTKNIIQPPKDENKTSGKVKSTEEAPKPAKRPTRGSLKPDDSSSSGKSSPVTVALANTKRRRI